MARFAVLTNKSTGEAFYVNPLLVRYIRSYSGDALIMFERSDERADRLVVKGTPKEVSAILNDAMNSP